MFSVVIPLYNKELNVKNTIESVLKQSFSNFEIIVVNDGSTDNSVHIVQKIDDSRIRIIHQKNQGVSAARNRGIKEAKYEWIKFLDADDFWKENHLKEFDKAIKENSGLNWLFSGFLSKRNQKRTKYVYHEKGALKNVFNDLLNGLKIHTSTVCIKKELFAIYPDLCFRKGLNNSEDREVWYKLCCIDNKPYNINRALSTYNTDIGNSLTKDETKTNFEHYLTMKERLSMFEPYKRLKQTDRDKINDFIFKYNRKMIGVRYIKGLIEKKHKPYLFKWEYNLYRITNRFPRIIKRIIVRLI